MKNNAKQNKEWMERELKSESEIGREEFFNKIIKRKMIKG